MGAKHVVFSLCILAVAASLSTQEPTIRPFGSGFAGVLAEANVNTRQGVAGGGGLLIGFDLSEQFALGLKAIYSNDFDAISSIEPLVFIRWLPQNTLAWVPEGIFLQAEVGPVIFFEDGDTVPWFSGGLGIGWRFNAGDWFLEPAARFGYPYMWGIGLAAGRSFRMPVR